MVERMINGFERCIQLLMVTITALQSVTCHMGSQSHSVACHPTQVNTPHLSCSQTCQYL